MEARNASRTKISHRNPTLKTADPRGGSSRSPAARIAWPGISRQTRYRESTYITQFWQRLRTALVCASR